MDFFRELEDILYKQTPSEKIQSFRLFYDLLQSGDISWNHESDVKPVGDPSYLGFCRITSPADVPARSDMSTDKGRAGMLHAIAHIEYNAIDLALDAAYRFRKLESEYYHDWVEVAKEEVDHFMMLRDLLRKTGYDYGDFPVHDSLHVTAKRTQDFVSRMAVVPRFLEANGLDANPRIMKKFESRPSSFSKDALKALGVILEDEIGHVRRGDRWFRHACEKSGISTDVYFDIVESVFPGATRKRSRINVEARRKAGFSEEELIRLQNF